MSAKRWDRLVQEESKHQWVGWHWRPENPAIDPAKRMPLLVPV